MCADFSEATELRQRTNIVHQTLGQVAAVTMRGDLFATAPTPPRPRPRDFEHVRCGENHKSTRTEEWRFAVAANRYAIDAAMSARRRCAFARNVIKEPLDRSLERSARRWVGAIRRTGASAR